MLGFAQRILGNQDVVLRAGRIGNHVSHALIDVQAADHVAAGALQHLDHRTFGATTLVDPHRAHQHPVTIHQFTHLPGRQKQVITAGIGQQKAETVAVRLHPPGNQMHGLDRAERAAAVLHQLAVAAHGPEALAQRFLLAQLAQVKVADQLIDRHRTAGRLEHREDQLTAGYRVFVACLLVGIGMILRLPGGLLAATTR